jgi:hypothetical protein
MLILPEFKLCLSTIFQISSSMRAYFFGEEINSQNETGDSGNDDNKEDSVGISVQKVTLK